MAQFHAFVLWLAELSGVDEWVVGCSILALAGLVGKAGCKTFLALVAGNYKKVGETAESLLGLLANAAVWEGGGKQEALQYNGVAINPRRRAVSVGDRDLTSYLNRKEKRLVFARAYAVKKEIDARIDRDFRQAALASLANVANPSARQAYPVSNPAAARRA